MKGEIKMNERIKELAIDWADQLDWDFPSDPKEYTFSSIALEKFAALVAAEEREACALEVERARIPWTAESVTDYLAAEIRARGDA